MKADFIVKYFNQVLILLLFFHFNLLFCWAQDISTNPVQKSSIPKKSKAPPHAAQEEVSKTRIVKKETTAKLTYYYDTRSYPTLNLLTSVGELPFGLTFWGFTDVHGAQFSREPFGMTRYFMEYRVSRAFIRGFGVQVEYNDFAGPDNNLVRLGLTYKHLVNIAPEGSWLQWRLFPVETDGSGGQASLIYFISLAPRWSISGFADLNWNPRGWVAEPQLNYKLNDRYRLVSEFRVNEFERGVLRSTGVAIGMEVIF